MQRVRLILVVAGTCLAGVVYASRATSPADDFHALCDKAMQAMMSGMDAKPSGDVDRDFVAMMVPHHQGAIDMAVAELKFGKDENLRRIAQEIIVDQQQEIAVMRLAMHQPLPPSVAAPTTDRPEPARTTKDSP